MLHITTYNEIPFSMRLVYYVVNFGPAVPLIYSYEAECSSIDLHFSRNKVLIKKTNFVTDSVDILDVSPNRLSLKT